MEAKPFSITKENLVKLLTGDSTNRDYVWKSLGDKLFNRLVNSKEATFTEEDLLKERSYIPLRFLEPYDESDLKSVDKKSGLIEVKRCKLV